MRSFIRRLVPESVVGAYHLALAHAAALAYGFPSRRLTVIGVTGTNGKSTTTQFIGQMLEYAGYRVGWTTTAGFKVGDREWTNDKKMTMLGRFATQRLLREMADAGCAFAVVETSSQGIAQHRHVGIEYDVAVFTNLTPEHIEAHGGFENYKRAKGRLFEAVGGGMKGLGAKFEVRRKEFDGKPVEKALVVNLDDAHAGYFLSFSADKKYGYGIDSVSSEPAVIPVVATDLSVSSNGSTFEISGVSRFSLSPIGKFNVYNALAAAAACRAVGLSWDAIRDAAARLRPVQGRLESVDEGQPFSVIVDYAYEPAALAAAYEALSLVAHGRIIHVLGSAGGGRDTARREVLGRMAAERDDVVIVTNEDPYDDDPAAIIESVAEGARGLKTEGENLFLIPDRAEAIRRAMSLAGPGDLVLITGKGNEPVMAVAGGKKIPWDDRAAAREALHALGYGVTH